MTYPDPRVVLAEAIHTAAVRLYPDWALHPRLVEALTEAREQAAEVAEVANELNIRPVWPREEG